MVIECPHCKEEVEPDRRVSMAGVLFLSTFYCLYYYWIKKRHCPACNHDLTSDDLQGYQDPDKTWKLLSAVPIILVLLLIILSGMYLSY